MSIERTEHSARDNISQGARERLQEEASAELSGSTAMANTARIEANRNDLKSNESKSANRALKMDAEGNYEVKKGDTLWSIARRSLDSQGEPTDRESVWAEMARIARINLDRHPEIWWKPNKLANGISIRLADEQDSARAGHGQEKQCDQERDWKEAPVTYTAKAKNCDRVEAGEGAVVVGYKGSEVRLKHGARGFAFPGSHFIAQAGSAVITVGGTVEAHDGSRVREVVPSAIIESDREKDQEKD